MLRLLAIAFVAVSSPAWAGFDGLAASHQWDALDRSCYQPTDVTVEESDAACVAREKLTKELFTAGWCFEMGDRTWTDVCPVGAKSFWAGPPPKPFYPN
jgi:hypothetical protein